MVTCLPAHTDLCYPATLTFCSRDNLQPTRARHGVIAGEMRAAAGGASRRPNMTWSAPSRHMRAASAARGAGTHACDMRWECRLKHLRQAAPPRAFGVSECACAHSHMHIRARIALHVTAACTRECGVACCPAARCCGGLKMSYTISAACVTLPCRLSLTGPV